MKRRIYLYWGNDEKYEVASDATISEEYSETLDSASVVIPNVKSSRGIVSKAKPYDEVYLSIMLGDDAEEVGRWMLIDSVDATQTSYTGKTAYFDVTLQLMSETKYLEKKQLPNVAITHSITAGGRSLYSAIEYYLDTYAQEYTGETSRKRLITMDDTLDWSRFKNVACADVMMSKPTLRQCLTTLMSQVGCIPVVSHRKLSWLDLGAERTSFSLASKGSIRRSVASDSWVNTLISESSQSVDENSSCVMEQLCFRDRDNVLLKQESNLKLETRYPIYEVKKLVLNAYVQGKPQFNHSAEWGNVYRMFSAIGFVIGATPLSKRGGLNVDFKTIDGVPYLRIVPWCGDSLAYVTAQGTMTFRQTLAKVGSNGGLVAIKTMTNTANVAYDAAKQSGTTWLPSYAKTFDASDYTGNEITLVAFTFSGTLQVSGATWKESEDNLGIGFATDSVDSTYSGDVAIDDHGQCKGYFSAYEFPYSGYWANQVRPYAFYKDSSKTYGFRSRTDITPLCVENTKRGQLEVDFLKMPAWSDIETMSKYLYATVGYSVGGNTIEGFSTKYSYSKGFWNVDKTYIENIISSLGLEREGVNHFYADAFPQEYWRFIFAPQTVSNPFFSNSHNFFSLLAFDVEYVPLIQAKAAYSKEDVPLPLEQLDSSESGVSSMDSVSVLEEQKADRLGNAVYSVHARVDSYADLPALNSEWDGRVAFKRTLKFGANAIDAEYMLSEDYVIRNYFTSVVTKYRAFEYVDYSQAVERRELMSAYIRLSPTGAGNAINAFPLATFPNAQGVADTFIDSLKGYQSGKKKLTGGGFLPTKSGYIAECELSAVATGGKAILTIKEYDNASDGPYVDGTYLTVNGTYKDDPIGGIPQKWYPSYEGQVWPVIFHSETKPLYDAEWSEDASAFLQSAVRMAQQYPRYYFQGGNSTPTYLDYSVYWLVTLPFAEKDISELLSVSLQFEAYWDEGKGKARFSKWLYRLSSALGGYPSESAYLAYRKMGEGEQWTGAKRNASASSFTKLDYLLTITATSGTYFVKSDPRIANVSSAIEVAVVDPAANAAYPLAWFAKGALGVYVYMSCVPSKSDKSLLESANRSLLYES